jgi:hypothetical protein
MSKSLHLLVFVGLKYCAEKRLLKTHVAFFYENNCSFLKPVVFQVLFNRERTAFGRYGEKRTNFFLFVPQLNHTPEPRQSQKSAAAVWNSFSGDGVFRLRRLYRRRLKLAIEFKKYNAKEFFPKTMWRFIATWKAKNQKAENL